MNKLNNPDTMRELTYAEVKELLKSVVTDSGYIKNFAQFLLEKKRELK